MTVKSARCRLRRSGTLGWLSGPRQRGCQREVVGYAHELFEPRAGLARPRRDTQRYRDNRWIEAHTVVLTQCQAPLRSEVPEHAAQHSVMIPRSDIQPIRCHVLRGADKSILRRRKRTAGNARRIGALLIAMTCPCHSPSVSSVVRFAGCSSGAFASFRTGAPKPSVNYR